MQFVMDLPLFESLEESAAKQSSERSCASARVSWIHRVRLKGVRGVPPRAPTAGCTDPLL